jgi:hypothetical protein
MTIDDIIRITIEAGFSQEDDDIFVCGIEHIKKLLEIEREAIIVLLKGIDQTECESKDGYWETSFGAKFGKELLSTIRARGQK